MKAVRENFKKVKEEQYLLFGAKNSFWPFVFSGVFKSVKIFCILLVVYYLPTTIADFSMYPVDRQFIHALDRFLISAVLIAALTFVVFLRQSCIMYFARISKKQTLTSKAQWLVLYFYVILTLALINGFLSYRTSAWDGVWFVPFMIVFAVLYKQFQKQMENLPISEIELDNRFIFKGFQLGIVAAIMGSFIFMLGEILQFLPFDNYVLPFGAIITVIAISLAIIPGAFGGVTLSYLLYRRFMRRSSNSVSNIFIGVFVGAIAGLLICCAVLSVFAGSSHGPNIQTALHHTILATSVSSLMSGLVASRLNAYLVEIAPVSFLSGSSEK